MSRRGRRSDTRGTGFKTGDLREDPYNISYGGQEYQHLGSARYRYLGMDNPWVTDDVNDYIYDLLKASAEGMEGGLFRSIGTSQTSSFARSATEKGIGALDKTRALQGGILRSGREAGIEEKMAEEKMSGFSQVIRGLSSEDAKIRQVSKKALIDMMLKEQQMAMDLDIARKTIHTKLK